MSYINCFLQDIRRGKEIVEREKNHSGHWFAAVPSAFLFNFLGSTVHPLAG